MARGAVLRWLLIVTSVLLVGAPVHAPALSRMATVASPLVARHVVLQAALGDDIDALLRGQGIARDEVTRWRRAARPLADLRRLESGRTLQLDLDDAGRLLALRYELEGEERLTVDVDPRGRLAARREPLPVRVRTIGARGTVGGSIKDAALRAGIPEPVISQLVDLLSWRLDFKEDVHRGDRFRVLWEQRTTLEGRLLKPGRIVAVEYEGSSDSAAAYLLKDGDEPTYIDDAGHPLDGAPLRYPLEFSRITSAFSDARMHPILHVNRPHNGVDFAAPTGTPVRAIGPGSVQFSGVQSGFGNHIEIAHGHGFVSAYSHLERIAPGVTTGMTVARGQLIGWVGQTGLATGPHLHFATFQDGQYIDPLSIKYPARFDALEVADTAALRRQLAARLRTLPQNSPATPTAPEMGLPALALASGVGPITLTF
ncbi:MAG TPA: peptidoglycan DD-metalloendopeptidase family protein [Candidatus Dormibacteraeota bacterium]|nr:peptidoglycan DD-metalloendopeptidase family protein [Candidatus Dormibacteraeota bacterium]